MKKKFYGALLLGSVLLAGGMVSCSDYDDDILSPKRRGMDKEVMSLKKKLQSGSSIKAISS